jgi:hypothetical protein
MNVSDCAGDCISCWENRLGDVCAGHLLCLSIICPQLLFLIPHAQRAGSRIRGQAAELVFGQGRIPLGQGHIPLCSQFWVQAGKAPEFVRLKLAVPLSKATRTVTLPQ